MRTLLCLLLAALVCVAASCSDEPVYTDEYNNYASNADAVGNPRC